MSDFIKTEIDTREVAEAEAWKRVDLIRQDAGVADHDATWWAMGFEAGAQWAVEQLPSRDEITESARKVLVGFTGECMCHEAYTSRGRTDPDCAWHVVGDDFPADMADAVGALIRERYEGES